MNEYQMKTFTLKDGKEVTIRALGIHDLDRSVEFFKAFSTAERNYFRTDVTVRENIRKRIEMMDSGLVQRLVALHSDAIIGDGALELSPHAWEKHIGEIRISIRPDFRHKGLGIIMTRELYFLAVAAKLEKIVVRIMRVQEEARKVCQKLGFHEEAILHDQVRDQNGEIQDLRVMSCNMKELWKEMEDHFFLTDISRDH
jgi:RimJ/RimL family protein N-acetyltransferase